MVNTMAFGVRAFFLFFLSLVMLVAVLQSATGHVSSSILLCTVSVALAVVVYLFRRQVIGRGASRLGATVFFCNAALVTLLVAAASPFLRMAGL